MDRVLIIEDEEAIADLERDYLSLSGYEVVTEADGTDGKKRALAEDFDMILLDLMLPGEDGFSIVKAIRESRDVPIIVISARKDDVDKIRGLGLGADDYMTKPFSPSELVARVKAHIERYRRLKGTPRVTEGVIKIRGMKIDQSTHEVFIDGDKKPVTVREYELLLLMASRPNHIFSKEEIFEAIWSSSGIGEIKTVAVHINRLREKIEKDPSSPDYIETVWGSGYRIKA